MIHTTIADDYTVFTIVATATATTLRKLIADASKIIPSGKVIQLMLTPAGAINLQDQHNQTDVAMVVGTTKILPVTNCLDNIKLTGANINCVIELFIATP